MANSVCAEITVFSDSDEDHGDLNIAHERTRCTVEKFPPCEHPEKETSRRNAVLKHYEASGFTGILHVISDSVKLQRDPAPFMADLESMMREFDYPLWLSTVTDPCNYVYNRYNPRFILVNDMQPLRDTGIRYNLVITSHSNTAWMAYDIGALGRQKDIEYFCEDFSVPMFYIIELLARRREHKRAGQLFYMNQYLTVGSELGVFRLAPALEPEREIAKEIMEADNQKFKDMGVKHEPDYNMNATIDALVEKIMAKAKTQAT